MVKFSHSVLQVEKLLDCATEQRRLVGFLTEKPLWWLEAIRIIVSQGEMGRKRKKHNLHFCRYSVNGFVEELPHLPEHRYRHACASLPSTKVRLTQPANALCHCPKSNWSYDIEDFVGCLPFSPHQYTSVGNFILFVSKFSRYLKKRDHLSWAPDQLSCSNKK